MEAYIDDMIVKSLAFEKYLKVLEKIFAILRKYKMKLNLAKCMFGMNAGKFQSFMASKNGTKPSLDKLKALTDMSPPRTLKEV